MTKPAQSAYRISRRQVVASVAWTARLLWRVDRLRTSTLLALQIASAAFTGIELLLVRSLLSDLLAPHRELSTLWLPTFGVVASGLILSVVLAAQQTVSRWLSQHVSDYVEAAVLTACTLVPMERIDDPSFHDRMMRMRSQGHSGPTQIVAGVFGLLGAGLTASALLGAVAIIDPLVVPIAIAMAMPTVLLLTRRAEVAVRFAYEMTPADRERSYLSAVLTWRQHAAELRALDAGPYFLRRHEQLTAERRTRSGQMARAQIRYSALIDLGTGILAAGALCAVIVLASKGTTGAGGTASAVGAIVFLTSLAGTASTSAATLVEAAVFVSDVQLFLEERLVAPSRSRVSMSPPTFRRPASLIVENVSFAYPGATQLALADISARFAPDEVVALVGENGCGKSTLAKLLTGLYAPTHGTIGFETSSEAGVTAAQLREHTALILQDFGRYALTVHANIAIGEHRRFADAAAVRRAARDAGAEDIIAALPDGLETLLGPEYEGGTELSLGQWQRIALARGFFKDSRLIILDEPTSALDAIAEASLFESMRDLMTGRAVILISHRFSTVRSADRILVMHRGSIVEEGSHDELIAWGGRYAAMYDLQAGAYY